MIRRVKMLISLAVRGWDICHRTLLGLVGRQPPPKCVVLYYHAVTPAQREAFAGQMDQVVHWTQPIHAGSNATLERGRDYSAVTFDDGFVSVLENAVPELESRAIPATIFVPTACLGQRPSWIGDDAQPGFHEQVVSEARLYELSGHALLSVGSHSVSHPRMAGLPATECQRELRASKSELERILGQPVDLFSLPHGAHDERVITEARCAGYRRVFGIEPTLALVSGDEFVTGRVAVEPDDTPLEFRLKLLGAYRWMQRVSRCKQWLRNGRS